MSIRQVQFGGRTRLVDLLLTGISHLVQGNTKQITIRQDLTIRRDSALGILGQRQPGPTLTRWYTKQTSTRPQRKGQSLSIRARSQLRDSITDISLHLQPNKSRFPSNFLVQLWRGSLRKNQTLRSPKRMPSTTSGLKWVRTSLLTVGLMGSTVSQNDKTSFWGCVMLKKTLVRGNTKKKWLLIKS